MSTAAYIVRDASGNLQQGNFSEGTPSLIHVSHSKDVSLNLSPGDVQGYERHGQDLHVVLAGGEVLVLSGYFNTGTTGGKNLFLSQEGDMIEVILEDRADGYLTASYESLDLSGKWSAYDELVFLDVDRIEPVVAPLAVAAGGLGGAGAAAGAAVVGGALLTGGGGSGSGGGNAGVIVPTVDDAGIARVIGGTGDSTVTITGTGVEGSTVEVTIGTQTQTATIGEDGTWSVDFDTADLPADGVYTSAVHVVDPGGNTFDLTGPQVDIDTTPPEVVITSGTDFTGDITNAEEQSQGTVITGTGEAGATVLVEIDGFSHSTTVAEDGSWAVTFSSAEIQAGEYSAGISITTTDARGNSRTTTDTLVVDTIAPPAALDIVERDDIINTAEASDGVVMTGTGEAGTVVTVEFQGVSRTATVAANGTWSVDFPASAVAEGTYDSTVTITAVDAAGNSTTVTDSVHVDTEINTPEVDSVTFSGADVHRIGTQEIGGNFSVSALEENGAVTSPHAAMSSNPVFGTEFTFDTPIADGTHLVVSRTDAADNASSSMVILEDNATNAGTLDHAGLSGFNIDSLNLEYAADTDLVLTEAQIRALSENSDSLTVHGGADDTITVSDAVDTGQTQVIDGQIYNVYTVGDDGATLVVEQDVSVTII